MLYILLLAFIGALEDDDTNRSGYAAYFCEVLTEQQINCASVAIKDFAKMLRDEWETIGMAECGCE